MQILGIESSLAEVDALARFPPELLASPINSTLDSCRRLSLKIGEVREGSLKLDPANDAGIPHEISNKPTRLIGLPETSDPNSKTQKILDTFSSYEDRIEVLKKESCRDKNLYNYASEVAFQKFFFENPLVRRGHLSLMENGNLRAVWTGEDGAHIGLQFIDEQSLQFVIFAHREPSGPISRICGRDTPDGIKQQIDTYDLNGILMYD